MLVKIAFDMSILKVPSNSYSLWIGDSASSDVLTRAFDKRTGSIVIREEVNTTYLPCLDNDIASDFHRVTFGLTFYNPEGLVINMSRGLLLTENASGAITTNNYSILLVNNGATRTSTEKSNYYFPQMRTKRAMEIPNSKTNATTLQIDFIAEARSTYSQLMYKDSLSNLISIMGVRSPI